MSRKRSPAERALTRVTAAKLTLAPEQDDPPEVAALADRFLELRRQGARTLVDLAVELGQILDAAREKVGRRFGAWARERLGLERGTADNYLSMARLAREQPQIIERYKELGASKLYQVARLPAANRLTVLRTPGVSALTDAEWKKVVEPHRVVRRKVTGNMRAHGLRQKVTSFHEEIRKAHTGAIGDPAMKAGLKDDLKALRRAIDDYLTKIK